jgi:hypothetical protein
MGKKRNAYNILIRRVKERHHLEDVGAVGRIILKLILEVCGESV